MQGLRFGVSLSYVLFGTEAASPIEPGVEKETVPAGEREARPVPGR